MECPLWDTPFLSEVNEVLGALHATPLWGYYSAAASGILYKKMLL